MLISHISTKERLRYRRLKDPRQRFVLSQSCEEQTRAEYLIRCLRMPAQEIVTPITCAQSWLCTALSPASKAVTQSMYSSSMRAVPRGMQSTTEYFPSHASFFSRIVVTNCRIGRIPCELHSSCPREVRIPEANDQAPQSYAYSPASARASSAHEACTSCTIVIALHIIDEEVSTTSRGSGAGDASPRIGERTGIHAVVSSSFGHHIA